MYVSTRTAVVPNGVMLTPLRGVDSFYYEVTVCKSKGCMSVGWIDGEWRSGDEEQEHQWVMSSQPRMADSADSHAGSGSLSVEINDTVGCLADLKGCYVRFFLNGDPVDSIREMTWSRYVSPIVFFETGFEFELNLGQRGFRFPHGMNNVKPVFAYVVQLLHSVVGHSAKGLRVHAIEEGPGRSAALDNTTVPVCLPKEVIATDDENTLIGSFLKLQIDTDMSWGGANVLFNHCPIVSGKWFLEVLFTGWRAWDKDSAIGCVGPDFFPAFDLARTDFKQMWLLKPTVECVQQGERTAKYSDGSESWGMVATQIQMR